MPGGKRTSNKGIAAAALAKGATTADAARLAGISERTLYAWKGEADFKRLVADLRAEIVGRSCGELARAMVGAARALRKLLKSTSESIRLRAAAEILSAGLKASELEDVRKQLDELREAIESKGR